MMTSKHLPVTSPRGAQPQQPAAAAATLPALRLADMQITEKTYHLPRLQAVHGTDKSRSVLTPQICDA